MQIHFIPDIFRTDYLISQVYLKKKKSLGWYTPECRIYCIGTKNGTVLFNVSINVT